MFEVAVQKRHLRIIIKMGICKSYCSQGWSRKIIWLSVIIQKKSWKSFPYAEDVCKAAENPTRPATQFLFFPMFPFDPTEIRKLLVFWLFEGDWEGTFERKALIPSGTFIILAWMINNVNSRHPISYVYVTFLYSRPNVMVIFLA